jgi:hypothetical protein
MLALALAGMAPGVGATGPAPGKGVPVDFACGMPGSAAAGTARCFAQVRTDVSGQLGPLAATPSGFGPADLQAAYKLSGGGSGQTVAIVDAYDDPTAEADLGVYRAQYGLAACTTANG